MRSRHQSKISLSLASQPEHLYSKAEGWLQTGRLIDSQDIHVGVRPAAFCDGEELDVGVTVQVSLKVF